MEAPSDQLQLSCKYAAIPVRRPTLTTLSEDRSRAKEYVEMHDQVQVSRLHDIVAHSLDAPSKTSVNLLDSLESFLSTFQKDLSAVSGQISELQDRSKDIESRLKSRRVCNHAVPVPSEL